MTTSRRRTSTPQKPKPEGEPVNLLGSPASVPLPDDCLPQVMQRWVEEVHDVQHLDRGGLALAMLGVVSIVANAKHSIEVVPGYEGRPVIWANLIGVPSAKKTPVMKAAIKFVDTLEVEIEDARSQEVAARIRDMTAEGMEEEEAVKLANQEVPPARMLMANDATTEALMQIMAEPQQEDAGLGMYRDELPGLVNSMNAYRGGKGGDRQLFLEMHGGGRQRKVRMTKGSSANVGNAALSIVGAMQPERLQEMCEKGVDDGWMQRFLYVVMPKMAFKPYVRDKLVHSHPLVRDVLRGVMNQRPKKHTMSDGAFDEFNRFVEAHELHKERPEAIAHWYGKIGGHWLSVALLLHLFDGSKADAISGKTAEMTSRLFHEFLIPSAEAAFQIMDGRANKTLDAAANAILRLSFQGAYSFSARDLKQNVNQLKKVTTQEIEMLVSILDSAGWCRRAADPSKREWIITPGLHDIFDEQLQRHMEMVSAVKSQILKED